MTYMWLLEKGSRNYRFQTDAPKIAEKMRRRKRFNLEGNGINCKIWIYHVSFNRLRDAQKALAVLSNEEVKYSATDEIYFA